MLEKLPHAVGEALSGVRAGIGKTLYHGTFGDVPPTITVTSPAFADGGPIPARHSADGPGLSPPIGWRGLPPETRSAVLIVEDPDAPALQPLVHLIAWRCEPGDASFAEGAFAEDGAQALGLNSFLKAAYLPPDPPTGHGAHRYLFQVYAVDQALDLPDAPGRGALVAAMQGHVLAKGLLTGLYERP